MAAVEPEIDQEQILASISDLATEATAAHDSFKRRLAAGEITDVKALAGELSDLFSITADLANATFQAHSDHFGWAAEVDDDLDALKEGLPQGSALLVTDAARLKSLLLDLQQNLRAPADASDDIPEILKGKITEAVAFIDEVTIEEEDDEEDDDEEGDPEAN